MQVLRSRAAKDHTVPPGKLKPWQAVHRDGLSMDFIRSATGLSQKDKASIVQFVNTKVLQGIQVHEVRAVGSQVIALVSMITAICLARFALGCS